MVSIVAVQPTNPVEYLACCGLLELADILWGNNATAYFTEQTFVLDVEHAISDPLTTALKALLQASLTEGPKKSAGGGDITITFPAGQQLLINWYHDNIYKCWGGRANAWYIFEQRLAAKTPKPTKSGNPRKTKAKVTALPRCSLRQAALAVPLCPDMLTKLFSITANSRSLGIDQRSAWRANDIGFSPEVTDRDCATYVFAELLAFVGLQRFRPIYKAGVYSYATWSLPLSVDVAIAPGSSPGCLYEFETQQRSKYYKFFKFSEGVKNVA